MLFLKACFGLLSLLLFVPTLASELSDKLQAPHYLLLMRHAYAPGVGDPQQFQLSDCQTQRNLNSQGRLQASNIGNWLNFISHFCYNFRHQYVKQIFLLVLQL